MHDDLLERRLRAALRHEADAQAFTITAAELERRLVQRGRLSANRRATLLVAAAVGIGVLGVGAVIGGLTDDPSPSPEPTTVAVDATGPAPTGPLNLGTLDEVIAVSIGQELVLAQAHDQIDVGGNIPDGLLPERVGVHLGTVAGSARYQLTVVCLGGGVAVIDIRFPDSRGPRDGPTVECDGALYTQPVAAEQPQSIALTAPRLASWRIVVRRLEGDGPGAAADPAPLGVAPDQEDLVRVEDRPTEGQGRMWGDSGLFLEEVGAVGARWSYDARVSCVGGDALRLLFGHDLEGRRFAATVETLAPCDGRLHELSLDIPQPAGSEIAVAAPAGARWSVLITGDQPPIALGEDRPGWQRQAGFGPHLSFDPTEHRFTGPGVDGGGQVLIIFACAGPRPIDVTVDVGKKYGMRTESFTAPCTPEGAETAQTFDLPTSTVDVMFEDGAGTWTAITILVPDPLPEGN